MLGMDQLDTVLAFITVMLVLSIAVTALVQIAVTVLNLRGWVLVHGVKQILEKVVPGAGKGTALQVAKLMLKDPSVTYQFFGRSAVAIRQNELIDLLKRLREQPVTSGDSVPGGDPLHAWWQAAITRSQVLREADALVGAVRDQLADGAQAVQTGIEDTAEAGRRIEQEVAKWFDTVMDRTSELFTAWSRLLTIGFAAAIVYGWQVDAVGIYEALRTNKAERAFWVQQGEQVLDSATRVLPAQIGGRPGAGERAPLATVALREVARGAPDPADKATLLKAPALVTQAEGEAWIRAQRWRSDAEGIAGRFGAVYVDLSVRRVEDLLAAVRDANTKLAGDGRGWLAARPFELVWPTGGMFLAWALLSLGAPFWFNLLRSLSNLRPQTADKIESEGERTRADNGN